MTGRPLPAFTRDQIQRLRELGVVDAQLGKLVAILPGAQSALEPEHPRTDVQEQIQDLDNALKEALDKLDRFLSASRPQARSLARARVHHAGLERQRSSDAMQWRDEALIAQEAIRELRASINDAILGLPADQTRVRDATTIPVRLFYRALKHGWEEGNKGLAQKSQLPFGFKPSRNPKSRFFEAICIFYEAIRPGGAEPERAVRTFIEEEKANRLNSGTTNSFSRGQQAP